MTFAELYTLVARNVWPERPARNLIPTYKDWLRDVLIELQIKVKALQERHVDEVPPEELFFSCGASVWRVPRGTVRDVRLELINNRCQIIRPAHCAECEMKRLIENNPAGSVCSVGSDRFPYGYDTVDGYGQGYYDGDEAPLGAVYSLPGWTTEPRRPHARFCSIIEGHIWLWPEVHSTEILVVEWKGVKRNWVDASLFGLPWLDEDGGFDREVQQTIETYLSAKENWFKNCDNRPATPDLRWYDDKVAQLIYSRRQETIHEHC